MMNIDEALKLAKTKAKGFNENPIECNKAFMFYFDIDDENKQEDFDVDIPHIQNYDSGLDAPIIVVYKDTKEVKIEDVLSLDEELQKAFLGL